MRTAGRHQFFVRGMDGPVPLPLHFRVLLVNARPSQAVQVRDDGDELQGMAAAEIDELLVGRSPAPTAFGHRERNVRFHQVHLALRHPNDVSVRAAAPQAALRQVGPVSNRCQRDRDLPIAKLAFQKLSQRLCGIVDASLIQGGKHQPRLTDGTNQVGLFRVGQVGQFRGVRDSHAAELAARIAHSHEDFEPAAATVRPGFLLEQRPQLVRRGLHDVASSFHRCQLDLRGRQFHLGVNRDLLRQRKKPSQPLCLLGLRHRRRGSAGNLCDQTCQRHRYRI